MTWLDDKADDSVVYVSFGSRAMLTRQQADALATALECSGVNFVWCLRIQEEGHVAGYKDVITKEYENRVANRGLIIKGWAPQVAILRHRAVSVFLTHCGWNSILEGISSKVLMLTWPMGADQFISAELLVNELNVGIRACEGGCQVVPDSVELAHILSESITGAPPQKERMSKLHDSVLEALQKGGSSSQDLDAFVKQIRICQPSGGDSNVTFEKESGQNLGGCEGLGTSEKASNTAENSSNISVLTAVTTDDSSNSSSESNSSESSSSINNSSDSEHEELFEEGEADYGSDTHKEYMAFRA
uniref:UDP-glycosyltransferase 89B1-like n=1 Tax=Nicotiana tabacum TaxID=4097 RepID=A0A1S3Y6R0_TOBAC|nr:PREDICTED: UDP-glycosyltransferase 89B1-like [Nicotiana tabacum]